MADRRRLPSERSGLSRKFKIPYLLEDGTQTKLKFYVTVGLYEDGSPGEIFIRGDRLGSFMSGILDTLAVMISLGLQHGVPLETIVEKMRYAKFEPAGMLPKDQEIRSCTSAVDLLAQWMELKFIKKKEVSQ